MVVVDPPLMFVVLPPPEHAGDQTQASSHAVRASRLESGGNGYAEEHAARQSSHASNCRVPGWLWVSLPNATLLPVPVELPIALDWNCDACGAAGKAAAVHAPPFTPSSHAPRASLQPA